MDFVLRRGEILGVAGLQGMGQQDLFNACFGMTPPRAGQILVDGREVALGSPADAIRPNIGIGMVPEDRKTEGLFLKLDGRANATLPVAARFERCGVLSARAEGAAVARAFAQVQVDRRADWTPAGAFSGGNQQKIAIAKWLVAQSRILLLFDPTRGIDVGTKHELYLLMRRYVEAGGAILFHSTEIPEIVHLCDRALVLYGGRADRAGGRGVDRGGHHARRAGRIRVRQERRMNTDLTGSAPMLRRVSQDRHAGAGWSRHRGLVTAIAVFALLLATVAALGNGGLSYFDLSFLASGGATLAIAAMGATLVILTGGFDLSAGAVISLVNVALALGLAGGASASPLALTAAGIAIGMAAGAFNGFFVAVLRLQPSW